MSAPRTIGGGCPLSCCRSPHFPSVRFLPLSSHCAQNDFSIEDAAFKYNLRTLMCNFVVNFQCTFSELAARPGVAEKWAAHVERSTPAGGAPRQRWRAEARAALAVLTSAEFSGKQVLFICEAQMLLDDVYQVRKSMHE